MGRWGRTWHSEDLTDEELLLLDGRCRPKVQALVDRAKSYFAKKAAGMPEYLCLIFAEAEMALVLDAHRSAGETCVRCGSEGYFDPLYVRGPKKGKRNHRKKRVHYPRVNVLGQRFCSTCWNDHVHGEIEAAIEPLYEVKIQNIQTKAVLDVEMKCDKCDGTTWSRDSQGTWHRCQEKGCDGYMRGTGVRVALPVDSLKVAKTMMR